MLREMCLYLQAGAHSTANAFTHTVDDLLAWGVEHPDDLALARADIGFVQRCMHESAAVESRKSDGVPNTAHRHRVG